MGHHYRSCSQLLSGTYAVNTAFALFTSDPNLIRCELFRLREQLQLPAAGAVNAVGMGSYAQEDVLLHRFASLGALPAQTDAWCGPESEAFLFHAGQLPVGLSLEENTQPFRYRRWMFCQVGSTGASPRVHARLLSQLPEFLQRRIAGESEAEACFALFLKLLRDTGHTDDDRLEPALGAQLLGKTARTLAQLAQEAGAGVRGQLTLLATNGQMLLAARLGGAPLYYSLLEGSDRCGRCGLEGGGELAPLAREHRLRRTVALATHVVRPAGWLELADGRALAVDRDLALQTLPV